jgi:hypothetical protein
VAALLVVGLLAAMFFSLARTRSVTPGGSPAQSPAPQTGCAANAITAQLPPHTSINDLAMTSTTEGWAVGFNTQSTGASVGVTVQVVGLIFHFQRCNWTALPQTYPGVVLRSISMVSATEGWAVGGDPCWCRQPFALHFSGDNWQPAAIPLPSGVGELRIVRMLNATEGWTLGVTSKYDNMLLHYRHGAWTAVTLPIGYIFDLAPVGVDDLWITGENASGSASGGAEAPRHSDLGHYQAGTWSSVSAPAGVELSHLRAKAPTDIYAMGSVQAASQRDEDATPADLHYDGSTWTRLPLAGRGVGQLVEMLSAKDGWAFQWERNSEDVNDHFAWADHLGGAAAQRTVLPTDDLTSITAITPMADGSYWALGGYVMRAPSAHSGYGGSLFLRYADGAWSQYGHL